MEELRAFQYHKKLSAFYFSVSVCVSVPFYCYLTYIVQTSRCSTPVFTVLLVQLVLLLAGRTAYSINWPMLCAHGADSMRNHRARINIKKVMRCAWEWENWEAIAEWYSNLDIFYATATKKTPKFSHRLNIYFYESLKITAQNNILMIPKSL